MLTVIDFINTNAQFLIFRVAIFNYLCHSIKAYIYCGIIFNLNKINYIMKKFTLFFVLGVLALSAVAPGDFIKIIHNTDPEAKCLDGSSPMIYLHEGGDTKNIIFHLIGGGACLGLDLESTL